MYDDPFSLWTLFPNAYTIPIFEINYNTEASTS